MVRMAAALCASLFLLLSGCASSGSDDSTVQSNDPVDAEVHDDGTGMGTVDAGGSGDAGAGTGGPATVTQANEAPAIGLEANVTEAEVPFDVNFTLTGTDEDGDALSWALDVDGDGEADSEGEGLPFNYVYTYAVAGIYNVTLTVGDGEADIRQNLTITAVEPPEPPVEEFSCSVTLGLVVISDGNGLGGCQVTEITADRIFWSQVVPSGCTMEYDEDGDAFSDGETEVGVTYAAGTSFTLFCGPGTANVTGTIGLVDPLQCPGCQP